MKIRNYFNDEKLRYLLIGFYNFLFGYAVFYTVFFFYFNKVNYILLLTFVHLLSTTNNFFLYSKFVFLKEKIKLSEYFKFNFSYLILYFLNLLLLSLAINFVNLNIYLSQFLIMIIMVLFGYMFNKFFVFKN